MLLDLLLLLLPLVVGYLIPRLGAFLERGMARLLDGLIYLILMLMGASLAQFGNASAQLLDILYQAAVLATLLFIFNLLALYALAHWYRNKASRTDHATSSPGFMHALKSALLLLGAVAVGALLGWCSPTLAHSASTATGLALYLLLLLIGHQLGQADISLKRILLNKPGMLCAAVILISSSLAGLCAIPLLHSSGASTLAIASGYGWYSLSAVMLGDQINPMVGGIALFNDLLRELVAIMLMPWLARIPIVAIGYCGATAMDVTLPIIKRQCGIASVPIALVSGFLLSLLAPLLMALFASIA